MYATCNGGIKVRSQFDESRDQLLKIHWAFWFTMTVAVPLGVLRPGPFVDV